MPMNFNNRLDDPMVFDGQEGFARRVSGSRSNLLDASDCVELRNMLPERTGITRNRRGFHHWATVPGTGPLQGGAFYNGLSEYIVVGRDGSFYVKGDQSFPAAGLASEILVNEDGDELGTEAGDLLVTGEEVPNVVLTDTEIDQAVSEEQNALVDENGNALIDELGNVLVTGATSTFAADNTERWYYAQVGTRMFASNGVSGQKVVQFLDDMTLFQDVRGAAPEGLKYLVSQGYRLFGVQEPDIIHVSGFLPDALVEDGIFSVGSSFQCGTGDADVITGLFPWIDFNLVVFKSNSIFIVNTNPAVYQGVTSVVTQISNFSIRQVAFDLGCISHRTVAQVGNDLWFLSRDGVRSLRRVLETGPTEVEDSISDPIRDLIERVNWSEADTSSAVFWNGLYMLAVPLDSNSVNDALLVYNTKVPGWIYWTGPQAMDLIPALFSEQPAGLVVLDMVDNKLKQFRDMIPQSTADGDDYLDIETESKLPVYGRFTWDGFVFQFHETEDLSGKIIKMTLSDLLGNELAADVYGSVTSSVDVGNGHWQIQLNYDGSGLGSHNGNMTYRRCAIPAWQAETRSFNFGEQLNPKQPDYVEIEFEGESDAVLDMAMIADENAAVTVASSVDSSGSGNVTRKRYGLLANLNLNLNYPVRELRSKVSPTAAASLTAAQSTSSRVVSLRTIRAGAFLETIDDKL